MKESKAVYVTKHKIRKDQKFVYRLYEQGGRSGTLVNNSSCQATKDVICTCRKNVVKVKGRREMLYYSDVPKLIYACHPSSYTDVGIGSVKEIQRKKVRKVYLPETEDRGVGSSDLSYFVGTRGLKKTSSYKYKRTSSKCIGGGNSITTVIHEKLSPIKYTKSETTNHELRNAEIGSNTVGQTLTTTATQFENAKEEIPAKKEEKVVELQEITNIASVPDKTEPTSVVTTVKTINENKHKKESEKRLEKNYSSDSLVQHIHNLEDPSFEKQSKGSLQDPMENKLEREYRKMFSVKSKDSKPMYEREAADKSASALRRRFEILRRGLAKKEENQMQRKSIVAKNSTQDSMLSHKDASVTSDPPSLIARSISNTKKHSPVIASVEHQKMKVPRPPQIDSPQNSYDSESQGVKGMFKLWGKKFNFEDDIYAKKQNSVISSNKQSDKKSEPKEEPKIANVESPPKKEGKKFFFFKKKVKKVQPPSPSYQPKKEMTTGRCEVSSQLIRVMSEGANASHGEGDITRKAWFKNFVSHTIASTRSVNVRWCNSLYATSSSTLFELMDTVYKNYGVVVKSRSQTTTEESSFYRSYTKHRVNFLQDVEAWMIPKTIPDRSTQITIMNRPPSKANNTVSLKTSEQKWYIEKSEALGQEIKVIVHRSGNKDYNNVSSEYLRIDIPKNFFETSSSERNQTSDEEVFKIVEYETASDITKRNVIEVQPSTTIKVIVSVQDSETKESKILETVVKRPPTHRDVLIQGSNVNIPKRCDVIGVGIITQREIIRDIPKPIFQFEDDWTEDDTEIDEPRSQTVHKKCELAESYLQDYYRSWATSGVQLPGISTWCASETHLRSGSENSLHSFNNQGDGTKCDDYQTILSSNSYYSEEKPTDFFFVRKKENKSSRMAEVNDQFLRVLPKDSLEVFKRRKLYARSCKSQWAMGCNKPASCPSDSDDETQMSSKNTCGKYGKHVTMLGDAGRTADATTKMSPPCLDKSASALSCRNCKMRRLSCDTHATITTPESVCVIHQPPCEEVCETMKSAPCHVKNAPSCSMNFFLSSKGSPHNMASSTEGSSSHALFPAQCPSGLSCNKKIMEEIKRTNKRPDVDPIMCPEKQCAIPPCAAPCTSRSPCPIPPCLENIRKSSSKCKSPKSSSGSTDTSPLCSPPPPCAKPAPCSPRKPKSPPSATPCKPQFSSCEAPSPTSCLRPSVCNYTPPKSSPKSSPPCEKQPLSPCQKTSPPPCQMAPILPSSKASLPPCQMPGTCQKPCLPPGQRPSLPCINLPNSQKPPPIQPCLTLPPSQKSSPPPVCPKALPCQKPSPPTCQKPSPPPCQKPSPPPCQKSSPSSCLKHPTCKQSSPPPYPKPQPCPISPKPSPPSCLKPSKPPCYIGDSKPCQPPPILRYSPKPPCQPVKKCTSCRKSQLASRRTSSSTSPPSPHCPPSPKPNCMSPPTTSLPFPERLCTPVIPQPCSPHKSCSPTPSLPCYSPPKVQPKPCGKISPDLSPQCIQAPTCPSKPSLCDKGSQSDHEGCPPKIPCDDYPWPLKNRSYEPSPKCSKESLFDSYTPKIQGIHLKVIPESKSKCKPRPPYKIKAATESTEEIRENMNIKVQDQDGRTLFERRDYGCGKSKPVLFEEIYKGATGSIVFTNVTESQVNERQLEEKSDPSLTSLLEIQLKLRVGQINNKAEISIGTDNEPIASNDKKSDIYVFKQDNGRKQITTNNDMSIKITFRNMTNAHLSNHNKKGVEFSKKISDKFQCVSQTRRNMEYTDVIAGPDDENVYSIHRATVNLAASMEEDSKIGIEEGTMSNKDCQGDALEKYSSQSNKPITDDENVYDKDSESERVDPTFSEATKSDLPDCNDTDEQENTLLEASSNESQIEVINKPTPKEEKKALLKKVFQKAHRTQHKSKSTVRQLRNMLKIILTDSSDNNEITNSTSELVKDVTYTSLKPNYFRDSDSMNNYYLSDINHLPKESNSKGVIVKNLEMRDSEKDSEISIGHTQPYQGCMCSRIAAKLNDANAGCCCKNKQKIDEVIYCDLKPEDIIEAADVETQKSNQLFSKANSFNISVHSKRVSARMLEELTLDHIRKLNKSAKDRVISTNLGDVSVLDNNWQTGSKAMGQTTIITADILQSNETKKAVLEIYAEKANRGEHLVAKLPRFVYDRESEITNFYEKLARNSYTTVCEKKIVMMSLKG